jgi:5-methylcytosine-specific restriction endonuclease McrA
VALATAKYQCRICSAEFNDNGGSNFYCSMSCRNKSMQRRLEKICPVCTKTFSDRPRSIISRATCSRACGQKLRAAHRGPNFKRRSATLLKNAAAIYGRSCKVCGFDRLIEYAHIIPASKGGDIRPSNILPLCPNHHRLFDKGLLTNQEKKEAGL